MRRGSAAALLLIGVAVFLVRDGAPRRGLPGPESAPGDVAAVEALEAGTARVLELYRTRGGGEMVVVDGVVDRVLPDDDDGSRHQRFVMRLDGGHTLLVAHNIDLADRVPLATGDAVRVRGEYEWNEQGGVLHWTHHDPDGDRPGGWVEHDGVRRR